MSFRLILLQQAIQFSFLQLLMLVIFPIAGFFGWRRGWKEEAITTVGLIFSLVLFANPTVAENMAGLLNRIINAFAVFINALFGSESGERSPFIDSDNFENFRAISFIIGVLLSYVIGSAIGSRDEVSRGGRVIGVGVGVLNSYLVLSRLLDFWIAYDKEGANLPFDEGVGITVSSISQQNALKDNLPTIFALLFLVVLIVTFFRLPRMRE